MNKRFIAVLVFAFIVASGASLLLYRLMSNRQPTAKAAAATVQIVLAAHNLEIGTLIKEADVKIGDWAVGVPAGASSRIQDVIGRGVTSPIYAQEPVLESRLAPKGAGGGLAAMIPSGMRAVAVRVNEIAGVAGFVVPGMRVDILISGSVPGGNAELGSLTKTMLQNIEVLSAGQDFKKDAEGKPVSVQVVNLLVTPEQAEQLSLASNQTTIQLVLRNPLDRDVARTSGTALKYLFTGQKGALAPPAPERAQARPVRARPAPALAASTFRAPVVAPARTAPEPPFVMEIIQGTKRNEARFTSSTPEAKQ